MNEIVFSLGYYDAFTGSQQSMYPLLTDSSRFRSTLLAPKDGIFTSMFDKKNVSIKVLEYPDRLDKFDGELLRGSITNKSLTGLCLLNYHLTVLKYFRSRSFDALYCNDLRSLLLFGPPAKMLRIPIIWYVRGDRSIGKLDRIGVRLADHLLTISDGVRSRFTDSELNNYQDKFKTLYTGVDLDKFKPRNNNTPNSGNSITFIEVASIQPLKGQRDLVEALEPILRDRDGARLLFAGDSPDGKSQYKNELKRYISEAGLDNSIEFLGWVDDIPGVLNSADVFVLPSKNEGLPRSILEAFASGLPVVATDAGGTKELVTDGENGFVVPVGDIEALRSRLVRLADERELRTKMGSMGRKTVEHKFGMSRYVSEFEDFICDSVI